MRKKRSMHMIRPGRTVTQNNMVETFCQIMYFDKNATHIKNDVTCKKCIQMASYPKEKSNIEAPKLN